MTLNKSPALLGDLHLESAALWPGQPGNLPLGGDLDGCIEARKSSESMAGSGGKCDDHLVMSAVSTGIGNPSVCVCPSLTTLLMASPRK